MSNYNLDALGIHELRDLGHVLGVKSPTTKNANQLKTEISDLLEGRAEPYIRPNKKGRPLKHNVNSFIKNDSFVPTLDKLGQDLATTPYQFQSENYNWVVAMPHAIYSDCVDPKLESRDGIVEVINSDFGMLRGVDCKKRTDDVYISPVLLKQHGLKSGDLITAQCRFLSNDKPKAVVEINERRIVKKCEYEAPGIGLGQSKSNSILKDYKLGGKYVVSIPDLNRQDSYFEEVCKEFCNDNDLFVCGIKLNAESFIQELSDTKKMVYIPFDMSDEQVFSITKLSFEICKRKMERGKNVVVIVDSLSKFVKAVNALYTNNATHQTIAPNALLELKKLVGISKCIDDKSSITLVDLEGNIRPDSIKDLFEFEIFPLLNK